MSLLATSPVGVETLDDPEADPATVARMLGDIARANRWFGGARTVTRGLEALLGGPADRGGRFTLLDVGTGAGDLPRVAARWGRRRGITITAVGIERHRAAARLAARNGVPTAVGCGTRLPFRHDQPRTASGERRGANDEPHTVHRAGAPPAIDPLSAARDSPSADIVLLSQLLHHFDDAAAIRLLREAAAVARRGVIVADLRPSRLAAVAFRVAGRLLRFDPITVADGVTSLARGRDGRATAALARGAGATAVIARDLPMARVLVAWRSDR